MQEIRLVSTVHRFRDTVALAHVGVRCPTIYLDEPAARWLRDQLDAVLADIENNPRFSQSKFTTARLEHRAWHG